ncbi:hypothetical protein BJX65DRAFT_49327 [Aspergillus insuetus]
MPLRVSQGWPKHPPLCSEQPASYSARLATLTALTLPSGLSATDRTTYCGVAGPPTYTALLTVVISGVGIAVGSLLACRWSNRRCIYNTRSHAAMAVQNICDNCGEPMREIQYQARSADEAQRIIFKCFNCPLDSSKLDFSSTPSAMSSIWSSPRRRKSSAVSHVLRASYASTRYVLRYPVPTEIAEDAAFQPLECSRVSVVGARGSGGMAYNLPHSAELIYNSPYIDIHRCVIRRTMPSPSAWGYIEAIDEYSGGSEDTELARYVAGSFSSAGDIGGRNTFFMHIPHDDKLYLCCELRDTGDDFWDAIACIHHMGYYPSTLYDIMDNMMIGQLSNLSPRAWDAPVPATASHIYTSKVDGQRMWILIYGRVCYYVSRLGKRHIMGWWACRGQAGTREAPVVLDVEFTACGKSALIDILVDVHGSLAPVSRDMRDVLERWTEVLAAVPDVPVYMRRYFNAVDDARAYALARGDPCDGIVGISMKSTEAIKIKDVRSVELEVRSDTLISSDGDEVMKLHNSQRFVDGSILEVRFTAAANGRGISVHEVFHRSDKPVANSTAACRDILAHALRGRQEPGDIQRRVATTWCRDLTAKICDMAWATHRDGNIVLDLGTGDGQSLDTLRQHGRGSYLLVEPDKEKCQKLARRAGVKRVHTDPMSVISAVASLQKGSQAFAVANMKAEEILGCAELMVHLRSRIRCVTATFSAQFCLGAFELCSDEGIPSIGCCYLYDGVRVGEYLLDASDVVMIKTDNDTASVKWGGDITYKEPALSARNFNGICRVAKGSSLNRLPDTEVDTDAHKICSKVYVVTGI